MVVSGDDDALVLESSQKERENMCASCVVDDVVVVETACFIKC